MSDCTELRPAAADRNPDRGGRESMRKEALG